MIALPENPEKTGSADEHTYVVAYIATVRARSALEALDEAHAHVVDPRSGAQWTVLQQNDDPAHPATLHVDGTSLGRFQFRASIDARGKVRPRVVKL